MKSWLEKNDIVMYSTHNEGKSVITEGFIRSLKNKTYKYMTSVWKNVYIDKLDDIVNRYNNGYHSTTEMKPVNVISNTYTNSIQKLMIKILNLELVIMLEHQNITMFLQCFCFYFGLKKVCD